MKRRTFDRIVSFVGLGLSVFLFVAAALLNWGASFADESVATQLSQQKITMPAQDSAGFKALSEEAQSALAPFSNMPLTTGKQAQVYADFYIGSHLKAIAGGKVYSEVSGMALAASAKSKAEPANMQIATEAATLMGNAHPCLWARHYVAFYFTHLHFGRSAKLQCMPHGLLQLVAC